jgi:hypothetical protein
MLDLEREGMIRRRGTPNPCVLIEIFASFVSLATTRWMICGWVCKSTLVWPPMIVEVVCRRADVQSAATACLAATPIRLSTGFRYYFRRVCCAAQ